MTGAVLEIVLAGILCVGDLVEPVGIVRVYRR